jgi:hypothetical protein
MNPKLEKAFGRIREAEGKAAEVLRKVYPTRCVVEFKFRGRTYPGIVVDHDLLRVKVLNNITGRDYWINCEHLL